MQRKCVAVLERSVFGCVFFRGGVGMSLYFSSQNLQYKSGSGAIEGLLPGACSKTLA